MGAWCSRRRRSPPNNVVYVPIMDPEQEPDDWSIVAIDEDGETWPVAGIDDDEDVLWQIQSFDDDISGSCVDAEPDPAEPAELDYPNLTHGRLVQLGFTSSNTNMPSGATNSNMPPETPEQAEARRRSRRAMHRWQHARYHITRLLRLRRIWANLGRVMSQWPDSQRWGNAAYGKLCTIWGRLGRTLQRLNSRALTGHLARRKKKLQRRL